MSGVHAEDSVLRRVRAAFDEVQDLENEMQYWTEDGSKTSPIDLIARHESAYEKWRKADAEAKDMLEIVLSTRSVESSGP
jgi:hypothetical protein